MTDEAAWRRCSACKSPIPFGAVYWTCSVSSCKRSRTALAFCSVSCWEVHLPVARHREAWAEERRAPKAAEGEASAPSSGGSGRRRLVRPEPADEAASSEPTPREVLIVASRLKAYVQARSGMNTSDRVLEPLSEIVRRVCDEAIRNAERDGRRTVLDRDVPSP